MSLIVYMWVGGLGGVGGGGVREGEVVKNYNNMLL